MHGLQVCCCCMLHSAFMLSVVKMLLKGEVGGRALNSPVNYIGTVFLNFCGNPDNFIKVCTVC